MFIIWSLATFTIPIIAKVNHFESYNGNISTNESQFANLRNHNLWLLFPRIVLLPCHSAICSDSWRAKLLGCSAEGPKCFVSFQTIVIFARSTEQARTSVLAWQHTQKCFHFQAESGRQCVLPHETTPPPPFLKLCSMANPQAFFPASTMFGALLPSQELSIGSCQF